ncbi:hypothetical protein ES703_89062 [subsurface metagenome]
MPDDYILFEACRLCVLCMVRSELKKNFCNVCIKSMEANRRWAVRYLRRECQNDN